MEKNNRLIAEFMGIEEAYNPNGNDWVLKKTTSDVNGDTNILESCKGNELQYHTSWDWLMPVISKCLEIGKNVPIERIYHSLHTQDLSFAYKSVVEFINQNN